MIHMPLAILLHTLQARCLPGPMFGLRSLKYLGYHEGLSFIPPESLLKDEFANKKLFILHRGVSYDTQPYNC